MNSNNASERVLITGAAGFLGSHLCDRFVKDGFQVIAMDNLITVSYTHLTLPTKA